MKLGLESLALNWEWQCTDEAYPITFTSEIQGVSIEVVLMDD